MTESAKVENVNGVYSLSVNSDDAGKRLDTYLGLNIDALSRNYSSVLIQSGSILVNNLKRKPGYRLKTGDIVACSIPEPEHVNIIPQNIPLEIVFQNKDYLVLNKKPGIVVHPAPGHYSDTIVNAIMWHCPDIQGIGSEIRPGIVHRIDKDTSGLLLIAKNSKAHAFFSDLFKSRKIYKEYTAVLLGKVSGDSGVVDLPIGRHPQDRKKMSIKSNRPRNAETRWTVLERFESATLVQFVIKTGRTHQIRVHSKAMGHPVAGDQVYRHKKKSRLKILNELDRQMLHASKICFDEPETGERICYHAPFHNDMATLIEKLRKSAD